MKPRKLYLFALMVIEWSALIIQLYLMLGASETSLAETLVRFFSYFTILTNILTGVYVTTLFFTSRTNPTGFFTRAAVQTAITTYITIVGLVYNIVLRHLYESGPLQAVIHDVLHTLIPVMVILHWWRYVNTKKLHLVSVPYWLIYPVVYAAYVLTRGFFAEWYPYPFLDVSELGIYRVGINVIILVFVFLFFSIVYVLIGRRKRR